MGARPPSLAAEKPPASRSRSCGRSVAALYNHVRPLRLVCEVCTINSRVTVSCMPIMATFLACPGAWNRRSAPRLAQAWAR